jgi:uncharacterized protein (DUF2267 family)
MCATAAHLVDRVLPDVPVRQWVVTVPNEVRRVLALRPEALTAQNRLFVEEIALWQKQKAKALGIVLGAICRRLIPQEARHLIAQLPSKLHADLAKCMDGPDKRITTHSIEQELRRELGLDEVRATDVLYGICDAVADGISAGEIDAVRGQLPAGMKELFPQVPYRRVG